MTEQEIVPAGEPGLEQAVTATVRHVEDELASEKIVVSAPLSYAGSAVRIWKLTRLRGNAPYVVAVGFAATILIALAWVFVTAWYLIFGILLVPYRLIRRGSRKRKRDAMQHREMLAAIDRKP